MHIELFDAVTPITVQNFLNYVNDGRFNNSVFHRSVSNFVIQGGRLSIPEGSTTLAEINVDGTIINEPGVSNLRGTVAMAKVPGDPNSATSQWFINLSDNSFLDSDNGGFTVFGRVIQGIEVADAINGLQLVALSSSVNELPVVNFDGANLFRENLVLIGVEISDFRLASNRYANETGLLTLRIDAGSIGLLEASFSIESLEPSVVIKALSSSVFSLAEGSSSYARFDELTGRLTIPELEVDGVVLYRNLNLILTNSEELLFTLESFE